MHSSSEAILILVRLERGFPNFRSVRLAGFTRSCSCRSPSSWNRLPVAVFGASRWFTGYFPTDVELESIRSGCASLQLPYSPIQRRGSISMDDAFRKMRRPSGHLLTEGKWPRAGIQRSTSLQKPALTMRLAACMPHTLFFGDDLPFALGLLEKIGFH